MAVLVTVTHCPTTKAFAVWTVNDLDPVPIASEVVVLDTGSSDRTRELAAALGARVETFEWTGDFAAARNAALDLTYTFEYQSDINMAAHLDELITSGRIVFLVTRKAQYYVRVSAWTGSDYTGRADNRSTRTVSLIQIRDRP